MKEIIEKYKKEYKGAHGNYMMNCLLNDAQSGLMQIIEHIENGDCADKYLDTLKSYECLIDFGIENTDYMDKEIAAMEKQPEDEYPEVITENKEVWEILKEYAEGDCNWYDNTPSEGGLVVRNWFRVAERVAKGEKLYRRVEITPEVKREREVDELGRELWQMHNDTMTEMRILPSKNKAWERGTLTDDQKKIWIETARKWMESKK